ncbi:alpha/beta hydrolase [Chengkuizengella axinellae]|uniref:Alpha/beta hydrolase n=1 Tax=Chengkuizengella axinellae TaxID=3064388 RepID=A0ABT9J191_9BACL|nr:alpha/beta hydrolase [Chengkuizengella sp. 2205SS18-9]MDP5274785.1 alpha/beta hydrolase [Chengkuizengella sp. 2205SS18-9]
MDINQEIPLWEQGKVPFLDGESKEMPKMIFYPSKSNQPAPAVLAIPGGGYKNKTDVGVRIAEWLTPLGIHVFVLDYRVVPYRHPCPFIDAQRAIRTIRLRAKEWNVIQEQIGTAGFSAGGHLAASLGVHFNQNFFDPQDEIDQQSCRPDFMILGYPVITFTEMGHYGSRTNLLGAAGTEFERDHHSLEKHVSKDTPRTFMWHTAEDHITVENSLYFSQALSTYNIPFELHVFPTGKHGLKLAEDEPHVGQWTKLCYSWLKHEIKVFQS